MIADHIIEQRHIVAEMNLLRPEHRDRLLTDHVMTEHQTLSDGTIISDRLDRGQVFDRHALLLAVIVEKGAT